MTGPSPLRRFLRSFTRAVSWHRRKLAVIAAVAAVVTGITAASPPPPATTGVVVAVSEVRGGVVITADHVRVAQVPPRLLPKGAVTDPAEVIGFLAVSSIAEGEFLTDVRVLSARALSGPGRVMAPLRLADADLVDLLHSGDIVDVLAADGQTGVATVLATGVRIVSIPQARKSSQGVVSPTSTGGSLVLVDVDLPTAIKLPWPRPCQWCCADSGGREADP